MKVRTLAAVTVALAVAGAMPVVIAQSQTQSQTQTNITPKHRLAGSYYWQQPTPPEAKADPKPLTPKHRLTGSYYWQQAPPPQTKPEPKPLTPKHRLTGSYYWQQPPPPPAKPGPKPEAKSEAKPGAKVTAASLAGKWTVNVETSNGPMESALELKADPKEAKKLAGTIVSQMGEAPIEGEFAEGKLTLWLTMNANGSEMSVTFTGEVQKDGSLSGTLDFGQGAIPWTAVRVKGH